MLFISNAFSLQMLPDLKTQQWVCVTPIDHPKSFLGEHRDFTSAVGHADTARVFSAILGREVPAQRISVTLTDADALLVGQYVGPRLPEGATTLPEGARIDWVLVTLDDQC